jgi:hypothetical protein
LTGLSGGGLEVAEGEREGGGAGILVGEVEEGLLGESEVVVVERE